MIDSILNRAHILLQQNRYEEAEKLLQDALNNDPNDIRTLTILAEVKIGLSKLEEAETLVNTGISIQPGLAYFYYLKARIAGKKEHFNESERFINEAINLDASDADYHAYAASLKLAQKQFQEALNLADRALELDAENLLALNIRSTALMKLDRKDESFHTILGALNDNPNNAFTHTNYGWNLLEKGEHKKALTHFEQALKIDPTIHDAQVGMMEAIKASNFLYRLFLQYAFFMSNLTGRYQWGVIIGFYLLVKFLQRLAREYVGLQAIIMPLLVFLGLIAFSTWIITPVSNLFLRLNRYGRYLLGEDEKRSSNFVGISLGIGLVGGIVYLITFNQNWLTVLVYGLTMMVPFSSMFSTKNRTVLMVYTGILGLVGLLSIAVTFQSDELVNGFTVIYILGYVAYSWIANILNTRKSTF